MWLRQQDPWFPQNRRFHRHSEEGQDNVGPQALQALKESMENVAKGEIGVDGKAAILHQGTENDAMNCPDLIGTES